MPFTVTANYFTLTKKGHDVKKTAHHLISLYFFTRNVHFPEDSDEGPW